MSNEKNTNKVKLLKSFAELEWELYPREEIKGEQLGEQKVHSRVGSGND
jgi:hypothetical protein